MLNLSNGYFNVKKSFNTGLMRLGLIVSLLLSIPAFLIGMLILENQDLRVIWSIFIALITVFVVLLLFKVLSWIIAGFFE